jgi:hypothetical protein
MDLILTNSGAELLGKLILLIGYVMFLKVLSDNKQWLKRTGKTLLRWMKILNK